ncbi:MAG: AAA family ATPase [Motiliproteus sp.]
MTNNPDSANPLIQTLKQPRYYPHTVRAIELIETHISWVLLTGERAYKLRKPVDFGFLNFTTLRQRFDDCCNELRLNRRFSPELYLGLICIRGSLEQPQIDTVDPQHEFDPEALDYAVCMVQFPQQQLLSARQQHNTLPQAELLTLAQQLAQIHTQAPNNPEDSSLGSPETVAGVMLDNFAQIAPYLEFLPEHRQHLERIRQLTLGELERYQGLLTERHQQGHIRECHGDLHLGNIALFGGRACPFDCIEFSPRYRWIDPLSDLAFLLMDLHLHQQHSLSQQLLNRYLEQSLDYRALPLLPLYQAYRAMVRAKVLLLSHPIPTNSDSSRETPSLDTTTLTTLNQYLELAEQLLAPTCGRLILMYGVSGSGKSWMSQQLIEQLPQATIRLRSDLLRPRQDSDDRYSRLADEHVYSQLLDLSRCLMEAGYQVIVDAAFLQSSQRQPFIELALELNKPPVILCCIADFEELQTRIGQRLQHGQDPSEATTAVLEQQLQSQQPLTPQEQRFCNPINTAQTKAVAKLLAQLSEREKEKEHQAV